MKRLLFILLLLPVFAAHNAKAQAWGWAKGDDGSGYSDGMYCTTDQFGNIYAAGVGGPTHVFGIATATGNCPVIKFDSTGNALWINTSTGYPLGIAVDTFGNVYLLGGYKSSTITFGSVILTSPDPSIYQYFLVKYNSIGVVVWAENIGNVGAINPSSYNFTTLGDLKTDTRGNIYLTVAFSNNPTLGSFTFTNVDPTNSTNDILVAKFDSSGIVQWAKSYGGAQDDCPEQLVFTQSRNIYLAGNFYSPSLTFGTTSLTDTGTTHGYCELFITKLDSNGDAIWAKGAGGGMQSPYVRAVASDASDNVYIGGLLYNSQLSFGGSYLFTAPSGLHGYYGFLAKYDSSGAITWAKELLGDAEIYSLTVDCSNNVWVLGNIDFSPDTLDGHIISSTGTAFPSYIAGWDSSGAYIVASTIPAGGDDNDISISSDKFGHLYICGEYAQFPCVIGSDTMDNPHHSDEWLFVAQYNTGIVCSSSSIDTITGHTSFCLGFTIDTLSDATTGGVWSCSNTAIAWVGSSTGIVTGVSPGVVTITYTVGGSYVTMIDTVKWCELGVSVATGNNDKIKIRPNPATTSLTITSTDDITSITITNLIGQVVYNNQYDSQQVQVDVSALPEGMYLVRINGTEVTKFVKQ